MNGKPVAVIGERKSGPKPEKKRPSRQDPHEGHEEAEDGDGCLCGHQLPDDEITGEDDLPPGEGGIS